MIESDTAEGFCGDSDEEEVLRSVSGVLDVNILLWLERIGQRCCSSRKQQGSGKLVMLVTTIAPRTEEELLTLSSKLRLVDDMLSSYTPDR